MQETLRGKFRWGEIQNDDVGCPAALTLARALYAFFARFFNASFMPFFTYPLCVFFTAIRHHDFFLARFLARFFFF